MSRLTKALELPHQVDSACASVAGIITMDKLAEVGQLCGYTDARRDHNDRLILSHWYTSSMGSAEQSQARHGNALIKCSVTEEFTSQPSPRLDAKSSSVSCFPSAQLVTTKGWLCRKDQKLTEGIHKLMY